jgi:hypothetical protein
MDFIGGPCIGPQRQRAGALQNAGANHRDPREREASWSAAVLRRCIGT